MSRVTSLAAAFVLMAAGPSAQAVQGTADAAEIAAAERAFAAEGAARGIGPSFVAWAAPEGIVLRPDPVNARERYAGGPPDKLLKWWPAHVVIARSGDLGFDTGPWTYGDNLGHGWFLTVWKRQADGSWKWLLDHGFNSPPSARVPNAPLSGWPTATRGAGPAPSAFDQVKAADARLAASTGAGRLRAGYLRVIATDAWVAGLEREPLWARDKVRAALTARPQTIRTEPLGGSASEGGDLAYTFGRAFWSADGKAVEGRYVRIWQYRRGGWKLVYDAVTPNGGP